MEDKLGSVNSTDLGYDPVRCIVHGNKLNEHGKKLDELLDGQKEIKNTLLGNGKEGIKVEICRLSSALAELLIGQKEIKDTLGNGKEGIKIDVDRLKNSFAMVKGILVTIGLLLLTGIGGYLYTVIFHTANIVK